MKISSIYKTIPDNLPKEVIEELIHGQTVRIKRIVSRGHASPLGFWYDQEENEWIIVLEGSAGLLLEGDENPQSEEHQEQSKHYIKPFYQIHEPDHYLILLGTCHSLCYFLYLSVIK